MAWTVSTILVFHSRFFRAKIKECPDFNPDQASTYGFMINANNFYGSAMQTKKLPVRNFELIEHIKDEVILNQILEMSEDFLIGFILEVDLEYPEELHNTHQDYPLASTKKNGTSGLVESLPNKFTWSDEKSRNCKTFNW